MSVFCKLFSEATIKAWITDKGTTAWAPGAEQTKVATMINGIVTRVESFCNIKLEYTEDYEQVVRPSGTALFLNLKPVSFITSITPLIDGAYSDANALDSSTYFLDGDVVRTLTNGFCHKKYKVVYAGGYDDYACTDTDCLRPLPSDLAQTILTQLRFEYDNRNSLGISSSTDRDGNRTQINQWGLLPGVQAELIGYKVL